MALPPELREALPRRMAALLDRENAAKDIAAYRYAPPGLRIWTGATVEKERRRGAAAVARLGLHGGETGTRQGGLTKRHRVLASAPPRRYKVTRPRPDAGPFVRFLSRL